MQMSLMRDVIVVGAGPAGSTTAKIVAGRGFDVQLVEKRKPLETKICGGGISHRLLELLSLPEHVVEKKVSYEVHHFPWGTRINSEQHVTVLREKFDHFLASEAAKSGAQLTYETIVVKVRKENKKIIVYAKTKKGEVFCTPCKIVVFADGVATIAGKTFPSVGFKGNPKNTALGAIYEVEFKNNNMKHYELYYGSQISPWGYGWIFPKKNSLNIGVGCLLSDLRKSGQNIKHLLDHFYANFVQNSNKLPEGKKIKEFGAALIPLSLSSKIFAPSCLVVGDAAGMVDPLLGCGIVHAVAAGRLAGQIAVEALAKNDFSERYLSRYQTLWEESASYWQMKKKEQRAKILHPFTAFDKNTISKIEYLLFFQSSSSLIENLRALFFPISELFYKHKKV
jgi:digeranylgeranylglycerophospholipid reductase